MTEPTDSEILDAADDFRSQYMHGGITFDEFDSIGFARAVLAKWGTHAPKTNQCGEVCERAKLCAICARGLDGTPAHVGVEPVASVHRDTLAMLNSGQVKPWDDGARLYPASKARFDAEFVGVYTTPQPTQAQARAVPLTDEQRARIVLLANTVGEAIDMVEHAHGIKGGQHGSE